ncbi:transporter substrate-binding domain-containing protein [Pseudomonas sp. SWRI100]|uniref:transporter substrate-binding domain-containing protein n=1 Tax=Pseudomonas TaxID=286 RepID=UPI001645B7D3|nr:MULTISPECIES: transporter substrate-binding domain-containing protein [Pseudomonas]MBC3486458.1 transporter substrate-binding domain-containing protein [Pseudomonas sp. SWRI50]MBC3496746.1 transporter substrate-binding domain-containing protein [Pseudomonas sp. SWRI67]MBV4526193.1 transporter substrate-binding domain-containing protein [Pseudomonas kermanshahensis]
MKIKYLKYWLASACLAVTATHAQAVELRFGVDPTYPPFSYKNKEGGLEGFEIEIGNALCAQLKRTCTWVVNDFDGLVPGLKARKYDGILSSMQPTAERLKQIDFTDGLYEVHSALVSHKHHSLTLSESALRGKSVGVEQGTVQERYANKALAAWGVSVLSYQSQDQVYADLMNGRLDASLQDSTQAELGFLNTAQGKDYEVSDVVRDPDMQSSVAIGINKGNATLKTELDAAIHAVRASGEYERLQNKYFSAPTVTSSMN